MKKRISLFVLAFMLLATFVIAVSTSAAAYSGVDKDTVEKRYQELSAQYPEDDFSVVVTEGEAETGELSADEQFVRDLGKATVT